MTLHYVDNKETVYWLSFGLNTGAYIQMRPISRKQCQYEIALTQMWKWDNSKKVNFYLYRILWSHSSTAFLWMEVISIENWIDWKYSRGNIITFGRRENLKRIEIKWQKSHELTPCITRIFNFDPYAFTIAINSFEFLKIITIYSNLFR